MSIIQAEGQFSRATARGSEIGTHDAAIIDSFLNSGITGSDKHRQYALYDPVQREAHDTFAMLLGIPQPDFSSLSTNDELLDEVTPATTRFEAHLTRQVIEHSVGTLVFYWAHIDKV